MEKPDLKLIKTELEACPVHGFSPFCLNKKPRVLTKEDLNCHWWINSEKHNYCFWTYIQDRSTEDGSMPELIQSQLAKLLGWSNTKTYFVLKQAMEELVSKLDPKLGKDIYDALSSMAGDDLMQDESYKLGSE